MKIVKRFVSNHRHINERNRVLFELFACFGIIVETHFILLTAVAIGWVAADTVALLDHILCKGSNPCE